MKFSPGGGDLPAVGAAPGVPRAVPARPALALGQAGQPGPGIWAAQLILTCTGSSACCRCRDVNEMFCLLGGLVSSMIVQGGRGSRLLQNPNKAWAVCGEGGQILVQNSALAALLGYR